MWEDAPSRARRPTVARRHLPSTPRGRVPLSRLTHAIGRRTAVAQAALVRVLDRIPPLDPTRDGLQLVLAGVVGLLTGVVAWALISGVHLVTDLAFSDPVPRWQLVAVPTLGGLVVGLLVARVVPEVAGGGVVSTMEAVAIRRGRIRRRVPCVGGLATSLALGTGASG